MSDSFASCADTRTTRRRLVLFCRNARGSPSHHCTGHTTAGFAGFRVRVNSNYKGFPTRQACSGRDRVAQRLITEVGCLDGRCACRRRCRCGSRVRTGRTTSGHRRSFFAADPDARRARGPHSLAEVGCRRLLELTRHSPYRSNLDASTLAVTRRWVRCVRCSRSIGVRGGVVDLRPAARMTCPASSYR